MYNCDINGNGLWSGAWKWRHGAYRVGPLIRRNEGDFTRSVCEQG